MTERSSGPPTRALPSSYEPVPSVRVQSPSALAVYSALSQTYSTSVLSGLSFNLSFIYPITVASHQFSTSKDQLGSTVKER